MQLYQEVELPAHRARYLKIIIIKSKELVEKENKGLSLHLSSYLPKRDFLKQH